MKLYFMLAHCRTVPAPNSALVDLFRRLRARGHVVDVGVAEDLVLEPDCMSVSYDLYILKSHSELWLSVAGVLHNQGARLLNPYSSCVAAMNKIVASERLRTASIPTPRSWVTGDLNQLRTVVDQQPLLIKPCIGGRGKNIYIIHNPKQLALLPAMPRPWLVQEYIPGPGQDLKLYVIGDKVHGVRKPFTSRSYQLPGEPCPVSDEVRGIALRCGQAFGLNLYGLDVIEGPEGPVVVDVNYFPSYKGVAAAAEQLCDYIDDYARGRIPVTESGKEWVVSESASEGNGASATV